ncbi:MAG: DUF3459 domain-containing protein, partial [Catenulispora sp.]|nr:DUF3459 domain-containing protein [Catenulispora sp.]
ANPALGGGAVRWLAAPAGVLAFEREPGVVVVANLSKVPVSLDAFGGEVLVASGPLTETGELPVDTGVWLQR